MRRGGSGFEYQNGREEKEEIMKRKYDSAKQMEALSLSWRPYVLRQLAYRVLPTGSRSYAGFMSIEQLRGIAHKVRKNARKTIAKYGPKIGQPGCIVDMREFCFS